MTEHTDGSPKIAGAAVPVVKKRRSFSIVWVVPLVALLIGGWLVYKAVTEKGPTITITFESAEGLEAGKTKVKYKDVDVGTVQTIVLAEDLGNVKLTVAMEKGFGAQLTENTTFWVVRARVAAGQVTGLGTLFSGAYIGVNPSTEGEERRHFKGLEKPPVVSGDAKGRQFHLIASRLGSLNPGSPIYFRQIEVGQVVDFKLDDEGHNIGVKIFIKAPYHRFVRSNTRFWVASGLDVDLTANGLRVDTESVVSLLIGGLAFSTFAHEKTGPQAEEGTHFKLYETHDEARDDRYTLRNDYIIEFSDSVRGLSIGAPVEFKGMQIGEVTDIKLEPDYENLTFIIPVRVSIQPQRFGVAESGQAEDRVARMVKRGLRAQLKTGNLLTGQLFIDIDYHKDAPAAEVRYSEGLLVVPSVPSPSQEIMQGVARFVKKLDQLPLEAIGEDLQNTMAGMDRLVNGPDLREAIQSLRRILAELETTTASLNAETVPRINTALAEMEVVLKDLDGWISADAPLQGDLRQTLEELAAAARSVSELADLLERHPEALIQGKGSEN